jgi:hypothetical protein
MILFQRAFGEGSMKPGVLRETGRNDLFKARLDQIIDLGHELVLLALAIDWGFLEASFGAAYSCEPGQPPLPVRRMAGLAILKHTFNLPDEERTARWVENPYFQYFGGEEFFQHTAPFDRSSMTRFRQRMGEERLNALVQESLAAAVKTKAMRLGDLRQAVVDTTVQEKAVAFPTDAKLTHRARERLVRWPNGTASGSGRAMRAWASSPSSSISATRFSGALPHDALLERLTRGSSSAPGAALGRSKPISGGSCGTSSARS